MAVSYEIIDGKKGAGLRRQGAEGLMDGPTRAGFISRAAGARPVAPRAEPEHRSATHASIVRAGFM
jgi:hypothetical protein